MQTNNGKTFLFTGTSNEINRIVRKHGDKSTILWLGSSNFEKEQMVKIDGHPEIVLEIAANLELDNVKYLRPME